MEKTKCELNLDEEELEVIHKAMKMLNLDYREDFFCKAIVYFANTVVNDEVLKAAIAKYTN